MKIFRYKKAFNLIKTFIAKKRAFTLVELPVVRKRVINPEQCRRAFTLIELLVTISIILLMAVLSVPAFNRYAADNEVDSKAEEIKSLLERSYSSGTNPPPGANAVHVWINYEGANGKEVISKADNSTEWIPGNPGDINDSLDDTDFPSERVILPNYLHLQTPLPSDVYYCEFRSPDKHNCGNIVRADAGFPSSFILTSDRSSSRYQIGMLFNPFRVNLTRL